MTETVYDTVLPAGTHWLDGETASVGFAWMQGSGPKVTETEAPVLSADIVVIVTAALGS